MSGHYELSGDRDPVSGELNYGGRLPGWQLAPVAQCVAWNGQLDCVCGNCEPVVQPHRHEDEPEETPGWTVQQARQP